MEIETLNHQLEMFLFHKQFADRLISVNWNWFLIRPLKNLFFEREVSEPNEKTQTSRLKFPSCCGETTMQSTQAPPLKLFHMYIWTIPSSQSWGVAKSFRLHKHNVGWFYFMFIPLNLLHSTTLACVCLCDDGYE